jgi:hypothetical protein
MPRYIDLRVSLDDVQPRIWRRFLLDADATFAQLHLAIQAACGWEDRHLFEFSHPSGWRIAGLPDWDDWQEEPVRDAATVPIGSFFDVESTCRYVYDFGDHWEHTVVREGVVESDEVLHRRLLDGAHAFPPEDCGGVPGYEACVEVARGGAPPAGIEHLADWLGDWHPERFDLAAARAAFDLSSAPRDPFVRPGFLPPALVALPAGTDAAAPVEQLRAAAADNLLLTRLRTFTEWTGTGRKLTATGNLGLTDGRALIELLGTDDVVDEQIGARTFKTKSTVELTGVDLAFRLSRRAGFVKVRKGAVSATRRGGQLGRDPLADWHDAFGGLLALGVLQHRYALGGWADPYWKELVDAQVPGLLAHLLAAARPVAIAEVHERLWRLVERSFVLDDLNDEQLDRHRGWLEGDVRRICAALEELGAVTVTDVEVVRGEHGTTQRRGGLVDLTPLGAAAARRVVSEARPPAG